MSVSSYMEATYDVRFYETDALQHVSNTVLVGWFESAREPIFRMFTPELDLQNWPLILASYKVDFLEQIFYGHPVTVRTMMSPTTMPATPPGPSSGCPEPPSLGPV